MILVDSSVWIDYFNRDHRHVLYRAQSPTPPQQQSVSQSATAGYNEVMIRLQRDRVRVKRLGDPDDDYVRASPAERIAMMWELTAEVWSLRGEDLAQRRLQRHVTGLVRQRG